MRPLLATVALLTLSACALPQQRSRTFTPYAPLEARITSTVDGRPLFHVNRPAYAAMFYIAPGQGVSLLYPGYGSGSLTGRVFAGSHFATSRLTNRAQFTPMRAMSGPTYYFLIASDRPLNVQQFGSFGDGLWSRLGTSFSSFSAFSTMEDLAELTLPALVNDGSWTTDFFVSWPSVIYNEPGQRRVLVRCGGYTMYVDATYLAQVQAMMCQRDRTDDRPDREPDAETGGEGERPVVKPKSRAPLPSQADEPQADESGRVTPSDRRAIRERIAVSSQLAGPEARQAMQAPRDEYGYARTRQRPSYRTPAGSAADGGSASARASRPGGRDASDVGTAAPRPNAGAVPRPTSRPTAAPAPRPSSGTGDAAPSRSEGRGRATVD